MRTKVMVVTLAGICLATQGKSTLVASQQGGGQAAAAAAKADDPVRTLVGRLDLERYKATVKGLTQFGDRRQGTERNRKATDWIEAQLKSYGCPTERLKYEFNPPPPKEGGGGGRGGQTPPNPVIASGEVRSGPGGSRYRGTTRRTGVNNDPNAQPDEKLRELNREPTTNGPREQVYCTKVGATRPNEMYIVGAHMDGHGWGAAANDNGSGTALVMELARVFSMPDVADRAHDPLRALEQRRNRPQRRARLRRAAGAAPGQRGSAGIRALSGAALDGDDSARHDDVGPRHAATGWHMESRAAARGRREHRVPVDGEAIRRGDEARLLLP